MHGTGTGRHRRDHCGAPDQRPARPRGLRRSRDLPIVERAAALASDAPRTIGQLTVLGRSRHGIRQLAGHSQPPVHHIRHPAAFRDADHYDATVLALIGVGATVDGGTINWNVRLSAVYPTVEVRVCDAQLDPRSVLTLALLIRALAHTGTRTGTASSRSVTSEGVLRDAALWHAARYGLGSQHVDADDRLRPAENAVHTMLTHAAPRLEQFGDLEFVTSGIDLLVRQGNGASAQRKALARHRTARRPVPQPPGRPGRAVLSESTRIAVDTGRLLRGATDS